jgi:hypothetical protein
MEQKWGQTRYVAILSISPAGWDNPICRASDHCVNKTGSENIYQNIDRGA